MLGKIVAEKWLTAKAVFGLYPARGNNEDIIIYSDDSRTTELTRWVGLRQQHKQPKGRFNVALADYVGENDYVGAFAVTAGLGIDEHVAAFEKANDDYSAIMLKSLADRFAEAAAEWLHAEVRTHYWGYASDEQLDNDALINEQYKGIRPAPGLPGLPGPHRQARTVCPARCTEHGRHAAHRILRDDAGGGGIRVLHRASGLSLFRHSENRARSAGRLG